MRRLVFRWLTVVSALSLLAGYVVFAQGRAQRTAVQNTTTAPVPEDLRVTDAAADTGSAALKLGELTIVPPQVGMDRVIASSSKSTVLAPDLEPLLRLEQRVATQPTPMVKSAPTSALGAVAPGSKGGVLMLLPDTVPPPDAKKSSPSPSTGAPPPAPRERSSIVAPGSKNIGQPIFSSRPQANPAPRAPSTPTPATKQPVVSR